MFDLNEISIDHIIYYNTIDNIVKELKLNEITSAYDLWTSEIQNSKNQIPFEIYYNASISFR